MGKMITILCPTRGRPDLAKSMEISVHETTQDRVKVLFYIDHDDPSKYNVEKFLVGKRPQLSEHWNMLYKLSKGDPIIMANDDVIFITKDWDLILNEKLTNYKDDIYCAWFDDGFNGEKHCAFPIISRKWINTLGYLTSGLFKTLYNDTWIFDIAKQLKRCCYIPEVKIKHIQQLGDIEKLDGIINEKEID